MLSCEPRSATQPAQPTYRLSTPCVQVLTQIVATCSNIVLASDFHAATSERGPISNNSFSQQVCRAVGSSLTTVASKCDATISIQNEDVIPLASAMSCSVGTDSSDLSISNLNLSSLSEKSHVVANGSSEHALLLSVTLRVAIPGHKDDVFRGTSGSLLKVLETQLTTYGGGGTSALRTKRTDFTKLDPHKPQPSRKPNRKWRDGFSRRIMSGNDKSQEPSARSMRSPVSLIFAALLLVLVCLPIVFWKCCSSRESRDLPRRRSSTSRRRISMWSSLSNVSKLASKFSLAGAEDSKDDLKHEPVSAIVGESRHSTSSQRTPYVSLSSRGSPCVSPRVHTRAAVPMSRPQ